MEARGEDSWGEGQSQRMAGVALVHRSADHGGEVTQRPGRLVAEKYESLFLLIGHLSLYSP
jgi:hypothetical protein